jgi:protein ImuB
MALAQARAFAADLADAPWDAERLARAALTVSTALLAASPRVAWERWRDGETERPRNEGVWWVDAAGLGDERLLAQRLLRIAKTCAFGPARVGIADAAIAAYAASFRSPTLPLSHSPTQTLVVPSGRDAAFLAPYPLSLLALDDDLAETLAALGLATVGQLAALETDEVETRFGPLGLAAHRLARGLDARGPSVPREDTLPAAACDLGGAIATTEPLLFVLRGALGSVGAALRERGLVAREVTLALTLDDGTTTARAVRPARPTSHEGALFDHCRALLEGWELPDPVVALAVRVSDAVRAAGEQGDLLAPRWADPAALEAAFDRIRGREGTDAVAVPVVRDGHLPEDQGGWTSGRGRAAAREGECRVVTDAFAFARRRASVPASLRLLAAPPSVRVRLGRSGLAAFRHEEAWYDVTSWSGPERLVPRWWRSDTHRGARDYFIARTRDATLWLLFRRRATWHLAGWWD